MNTFANAFAIISPYVAGYTLELLGVEKGMRLLYGLLAGVSAVNATLAIKYLQETTELIHKVKDLRIFVVLKETYTGIPELVSKMPLSVKALGLVSGFSFISNGLASPFWVVYATEIIGLSTVKWGLILLLESILKTAFMIPAGVFSDRYSRTISLLAAVTLTLVAFPMMILAKSFIQVFAIRILVGLAGALYFSSSSALMADYVPRKMRGKVMAAIGRGSVIVGAVGGGTGGPGMGYLFTIPVMASSILGGVLYNLNPNYVWIVLLLVTIIQIGLIVSFIRDPENAEE
jgi:MFS family permease